MKRYISKKEPTGIFLGTVLVIVNGTVAWLRVYVGRRQILVWTRMGKVVDIW